MPPGLDRRAFLGALAALPLASAPATAQDPASSRPGPKTPKIKLSCNLYSFNEPLRRQEMTLERALEDCAELGFDAVDPTGYYFPGYPEAPPDRFLYEIKKRAFPIPAARTIVDYASLGSDAGFIGAAGCARMKFGKDA